jgi:hypothetical protein
MNFDTFKDTLIRSGILTDTYVFDQKLFCGEPAYSAVPFVHDPTKPKFWALTMQDSDIHYSINGSSGSQSPESWPTNPKDLCRMMYGTWLCSQHSFK